ARDAEPGGESCGQFAVGGPLLHQVPKEPGGLVISEQPLRRVVEKQESAVGREPANRARRIGTCHGRKRAGRMLLIGARYLITGGNRYYHRDRRDRRDGRNRCRSGTKWPGPCCCSACPAGLGPYRRRSKQSSPRRRACPRPRPPNR